MACVWPANAQFGSMAETRGHISMRRPLNKRAKMVREREKRKKMGFPPFGSPPSRPAPSPLFSESGFHPSGLFAAAFAVFAAVCLCCFCCCFSCLCCCCCCFCCSLLLLLLIPLVLFSCFAAVFGAAFAGAFGAAFAASAAGVRWYPKKKSVVYPKNTFMSPKTPLVFCIPKKDLYPKKKSHLRNPHTLISKVNSLLLFFLRKEWVFCWLRSPRDFKNNLCRLLKDNFHSFCVPT